MHKGRKILSIFVTTMLSLIAILQAIAAGVAENKDPINEEIVIPIWVDKILKSEGFIYFLIVLAVVVIIMMLLDLCGETKQHKFKAQRKRFYNFFTKWYSRPGKLTIICDDLNWIESANDKRVLNILEKKAKENNLVLFLGSGTRPDLLQNLKDKGAKVKKAPRGIISQYSFSCLSVMGNNASVIVRNKQADSGEIVKFEEISNTYVSELLNALLTEA